MIKKTDQEKLIEKIENNVKKIRRLQSENETDWQEVKVHTCTYERTNELLKAMGERKSDIETMTKQNERWEEQVEQLDRRGYE